ncbi:MAG: response regulator [Spirochaetales bacterium]|nr:response regulator [Spirochaetales bacterium]
MKEDNEVKETILVIDDETAIRNSYRDYLEDLEYNVFSAENGLIGLRIFEKEDIDLIVVDLQMPELDGLEVLKAVTETSPELPIIVVSGTGVIGDVVEALRLGAWDYLLKPVEDLLVFKHAVEKSLERARLKEEHQNYQDDLERQVLSRTAELEAEVGMRRSAEIEMRKTLQEKEVLLQEVHHRVKNNLAIISAFVSLKEQGESDSDIRNTFQDLQQRIKTMALVHEKLYQSDNFKEISVRDYVNDLCSEIVGNYNTGTLSVESRTNVEDLFFTLDVLIPIGLIINEIVINSIRHAFTGIAMPLVMVNLSLENESEVILCIADNGNGFIETEDDKKNNHFGIEIIKALVIQLHGSMKYKTVGGTEYIIKFELKQK